MKKTVGLFLVIAVLVSLCSVSAFAADSSLSIASVSLSGEDGVLYADVVINVTADGAVGVKLAYEDSSGALDLDESSLGKSSFGPGIYEGNDFYSFSDSECQWYSWSIESGLLPKNLNGTFVTLRFVVDPTALPTTFTVAGSAATEGKLIFPDFTNGAIVLREQSVVIDLPEEPEEPEEPETVYYLGDVDGNGSVGVNDAVQILKYDAFMDVQSEYEASVWERLGDVNGQDGLNYMDAIDILQWDAFLEFEYPIGEPVEF